MLVLFSVIGAWLVWCFVSELYTAYVNHYYGKAKKQ